MENAIVCSFVTENSPYTAILEKYLLKSIKAFSLPSHIEYTKNLGSWIRNTTLKPSILLKCMEKFPNKDIIYLDADCSIKQYPKLFDELFSKCDIGLHYLQLQNFYNIDSPKEEALSSVLYLSNNELVYDLIKRWEKKCAEGSVWEQRELQKLLADNITLKIHKLPFEYNYILTLPKPRQPIKVGYPVIVQCPILYQNPNRITLPQNRQEKPRFN